jgi:hypothetical protein
MRAPGSFANVNPWCGWDDCWSGGLQSAPGQKLPRKFVAGGAAADFDLWDGMPDAGELPVPNIGPRDLPAPAAPALSQPALSVVPTATARPTVRPDGPQTSAPEVDRVEVASQAAAGPDVPVAPAAVPMAKGGDAAVTGSGFSWWWLLLLLLALLLIAANRKRLQAWALVARDGIGRGLVGVRRAGPVFASFVAGSAAVAAALIVNHFWWRK